MAHHLPFADWGIRSGSIQNSKDAVHDPSGTAWLARFRVEDRPTAALLIDSLEIHDQTNMQGKLAERVRVSAMQTYAGTPVVVVPIRSKEDLPDLEGEHPEHIAYMTFDPGAPLPILPGSEAEVGALSRTLVQEDPAIFLSPETTLDEIRIKKVRQIYLVSDYAGSGNQAALFAKSFTANPTVASWMSYKLLTIKVFTYAASLDATILLSKEPHFEFETLVSAKSAKSANWSREQRDQIVQLCRDYADGSEQLQPLGYKDSFGLYLSNWRVPNNLPQILIQSGSQHPGLFSGRQIPQDFREELTSYRPTVNLTQTLRNLGADTLANSLEGKSRPIKGLRALAALQLLDHGLAEDEVWAMLGLDQNKVDQLRGTLLALDCITISGKVTKQGNAELQRATQVPRRRPKYQHEPNPPVGYQPTQLR